MTESFTGRLTDMNQRLDDMNQSFTGRLTDMNQTLHNRLNDMNQKLTTFMWVVSGWFMFLTAVLAVFGFPAADPSGSRSSNLHLVAGRSYARSVVRF